MLGVCESVHKKEAKQNNLNFLRQFDSSKNCDGNYWIMISTKTNHVFVVGWNWYDTAHTAFLNIPKNFKI